MAEMVGSAIIQEAVSRVSSILLDKREDKNSETYIIERLKMSTSELEFALELSAKLPITDISLLRRRKFFEYAHIEATHLLNKHKPRLEQEDQEIEDTSRGRSLYFSSLICLKNEESSCLSCSDVQRFEWLADCARKFVRDVESSCQLRHYTFCNPLIRQLLEGKTLWYGTARGTQVHKYCVWPICREGHGVEVELQYQYADHKMPEKHFHLALMLRLSESIDIVGIAMKCLQSLASQFKLDTDFAMGQLLPNLQDITNCSSTPPLVGIQPQHIRHGDILRPDPICCKTNVQGLCAPNIISPELSHILPEPVIYAAFHSNFSALEYKFRGSTHEVNRNALSGLPSLELAAVVVPHLVQENQKQSHAYEVIGFKEHRRDGGIQQMTEMVRSEAIGRLTRQPELTDYGMLWISAHGSAYYGVRKLSTEIGRAPETDNSRSKTRRVAKRRRRNLRRNLM